MPWSHRQKKARSERDDTDEKSVIALRTGRQEEKAPIAPRNGRGAASKLGFLARFAQVDNPTSSARTQQLLNWKPTHADLLADLAERHYFAS